MASLEFHIVVEVNIDILTVLCIAVWYLISYFFQRPLMVERSESIGSDDDRLEWSTETSMEDSDYQSVEEGDDLTPKEIHAVIAKYWTSLGEDEVANLEIYLELD